MKQQKTFRQQEQQISEVQSQSQTRGTMREFASPEEMLRFDAKHTAVPPRIAQKLSDSLKHEPVAPRSWWKRWWR